MRNLLIILFIFCFGGVMAQSKLSYKETDSLTYKYFVEKNYIELIKISNTALSDSIDFYYLRMRLGIAYYNQQQYKESVVHFKNAFEMNPTAESVGEYYYYSLLFSGDKRAATEIYPQLSSTAQSNIQAEKSETQNFNYGSFTAGLVYNDNVSSAIMPLPTNNYKNENIQNTTYITNLYVDFKLNKAWRMSHNLGVFNVNNQSSVYTNNAKLLSVKYSTTIFQYNPGISYTSNSGFVSTAFLGYYQEKSYALAGVYNSTITASEIPYQSNAFSFSLSGYKKFKKIALGANLSLANFSGYNQLQTGLNFTYYPSASTYFYSSAVLLLNNGVNQFIGSQYAGFNLSKKIAFNLGASVGNHQNYISNGGTIAFNTAEPIYFNADATLNFKFKKLNFIPSFVIQQREQATTFYNAGNLIKTNKQQYLNQIIKCTLQWKF